MGPELLQVFGQLENYIKSNEVVLQAECLKFLKAIAGKNQLAGVGFVHLAHTREATSGRLSCC